MGIIANWAGAGLPAGQPFDAGTAGPGDTPFTVGGQAFTTAAGPSGGVRIQVDHVGGTVPALWWGQGVLGSSGLTAYAFRFYLELSALPSTSFTILSGRTAGNTTQTWRVDVAGLGAGSQAGQIRLRDSGNTQRAASGNLVLEPGVAYRVEVAAQAGELMVAVYPGDSLASLLILSAPVGGAVDTARFGLAASSPLVPRLWMWGFAAADTGAEIGPSATRTPAVSVWTGTREVPLRFPLVHPDGAPAGTAHAWAPTDYGLAAWSGDPAGTEGMVAAEAGRLLVWRLKVPKPSTVANVVLHLDGSPGLTAGQNFAGLYGPDGALLSASADQTANWASPGTKVAQLGPPVQVDAGFVYAAALFNGPVLPALPVFGAAAAVANLGQPGRRFGVYGDGSLVELPAAIPTGAVGDALAALWVGLS